MISRLDRELIGTLDAVFVVAVTRTVVATVPALTVVMANPLLSVSPWAGLRVMLPTVVFREKRTA